MNKKIALKLLMHMAGVAIMMTLLIATSLMYTGYRQQSIAESFWGDLYDPNEDHRIDYGLAGVAIPDGGPIVSISFLEVCPDHPVDLAPLRYAKDGIEVLCGLGGSAEIIYVPYDSIKHPELVEAIKKEQGRVKN